ncbi:hypothetical protein [Bacillus sp. MUM 13]|uniref:hypothetical protein n=1 Tax=Bacillus sp. MUM 13 TaxID=1678001 RepID=UPI0008F5B7F8|nr:hypothetical protein [Bacillus sp. MUM 13]OIK08813.1 hypothetical protein BIV59_18690 [Bacillus sp. MUM 13]
MRFSWDDQTSDADLDHFEVYFNKGTEASPTSDSVIKTYPRTYTGNNLIHGEGTVLDSLGVQDGDTVYITVYAVDASGNKSNAAKTHTLYLVNN